jgi:hypothetical protein
VPGGEIAVAVEGVEVRLEQRVAPHAIARLAGAALGRRGCDSHDAELVAVALERLVGKQGLVGLVDVGKEGGHLGLGVALGHIGDVNAAQRVGSTLHDHMRRSACCIGVARENVAGHYLVGERGSDAVAAVAQVDGDIDRVDGHGHEKHVFKRTAGDLCLGAGEPLLKQGGE